MKVSNLGKKKVQGDHIMIWYRKEKNNVLTFSWKAHVRNLETESKMDLLNQWMWKEKENTWCCVYKVNGFTIASKCFYLDFYYVFINIKGFLMLCFYYFINLFPLRGSLG